MARYSISCCAIILLLIPIEDTVTAASYSGQQHQAIKSLTPSEVEDLHLGRGMGLAKAAELNHYPGPLHVLELRKELHLSTEQLLATERLFNEMRARAVEIGRRIIELERALDDLFAQQTVSAEKLSDHILLIANARANLRAVHLGAHIEQRELLSAHQIARYDQLRGYSSGNGHDHSKHNH